MKFQVFENVEPRYPRQFRTSQDVYNDMKGFARADREMFIVVYPNAKNIMIDSAVVSLGGVDSAGVFPKEVFKGAVNLSACAVILVHNHPSGEVDPSAGDNAITKTLIYCAGLLNIQVIDHVIIGQDKFYSYADNGLIDEYEKQANEFFITKI